MTVVVIDVNYVHTHMHTEYNYIKSYMCIGFQALLVICPQDTRKNFKPVKSSSSEAHSTPSTQLFLTQVLFPLLETHRTDKPLHELLQVEAKTKALSSPGAISYHIDELRLTRLHTAALQISTEHMARYNIYPALI